MELTYESPDGLLRIVEPTARQIADVVLLSPANYWRQGGNGQALLSIAGRPCLSILQPGAGRFFLEFSSVGSTGSVRRRELYGALDRRDGRRSVSCSVGLYVETCRCSFGPCGVRTNAQTTWRHLLGAYGGSAIQGGLVR